MKTNLKDALKNVALVVTIVIALIKIYDWVHEPSQKLVAEITSHSSSLPPDLEQKLVTLSAFSQEIFYAKEANIQEILDRFESDESRELAIELVNYFEDHLKGFVRTNFSKMMFHTLFCKIKNDGSKALYSCNLKLPDFEFASIERPGEKKKIIDSGKTIQIGTIQPKEEILITTWVTLPIFLYFGTSNIHLTHDSGIGEVNFRNGKDIKDIMGLWVPPYFLLITVILFTLSSFNLLFRTKKNSPQSTDAKVKDDKPNPQTPPSQN